MTEILEKSLMIGFGITLLVIFLSIITPFFKFIENYNIESDIKNNLICISIINSGITRTIENPSLNFSCVIEMPENFSILASGNKIKYTFILNNIEYEYTYEFIYQFLNFFYENPGYHILKIYIISEVIFINFL